MPDERVLAKSRLSAFSLFILLNIILRRIHQSMLKSHVEMVLSNSYNGAGITAERLTPSLSSKFKPLLSTLLTRKVGRKLTFVATFFTMATLLSSARADINDVLHLTVELAALVAIFRTALVWHDDDGAHSVTAD